MTYHDYMESCIEFARDTKDWAELDPYNFYSVTPTGWRESSDNACNGILCDWAFHKDDAYIRLNAHVEFLDNLTMEVEQALDEGFDAEQYQTIAEKYT